MGELPQKQTRTVFPSVALRSREEGDDQMTLVCTNGTQVTKRCLEHSLSHAWTHSHNDLCFFGSSFMLSWYATLGAWKVLSGLGVGYWESLGKRATLTYTCSLVLSWIDCLVVLAGMFNMFSEYIE